MSLGIVDLSNPGMPIVMLDQAHLCQDCNAIAAAPNGQCVRCGSKSLLTVATVLNRKRNYAGACLNQLMENETKESLAELYMDLLAERRAGAQKGEAHV